MATVELNGIEVCYEVHGDEAGPWVLNIGGTGGDLRRTFPHRSPLNKRLHVVHYDQRGLGRTSRPEVDYSMADYADDAAGLIEHTVGGTCHVIGTSFGGMVALNLALRHPHLVDRLVLMCTSPGGSHASYRLPELAKMDAQTAFETRMTLFDSRWDPKSDDPLPGLGPLYDIVVEQNRAVHPPEVAAGLARQLAARDAHDVVADLGSIDHDTLICAGRFDGLAPLANSEFLRDHLVNSRLEVFDAGHLLMLQNRTVVPTIVDFLLA